MSTTNTRCRRRRVSRQPSKFCAEQTQVSGITLYFFQILNYFLYNVQTSKWKSNFAPVAACKPVASAILHRESGPLHVPMHSSVSILRFCASCHFVPMFVFELFICTVHSLIILFFSTSNCSEGFPLRL